MHVWVCVCTSVSCYVCVCVYASVSCICISENSCLSFCFACVFSVWECESEKERGGRERRTQPAVHLCYVNNKKKKQCCCCCLDACAGYAFYLLLCFFFLFFYFNFFFNVEMPLKMDIGTLCAAIRLQSVAATTTTVSSLFTCMLICMSIRMFVCVFISNISNNNAHCWHFVNGIELWICFI